jgi:hypothetical protein
MSAVPVFVLGLIKNHPPAVVDLRLRNDPRNIRRIAFLNVNRDVSLSKIVQLIYP